MAVVPLALSVHNFISSVGADAGFASVIGLAILTLLYFSHARETANLRQEAAELALRLQEAEARLADTRRVQPLAPQAVPAPPVKPAVGTVPALLAPFAPAGVAAPALAAATRFIPGDLAAPAYRPAVTPAPAPAMADEPPVVAPVPAGAPTATPPPTPAPAPHLAPIPAPAPAMAPAATASAATISRPATAAGAANGGSLAAPSPAGPDRFAEPPAASPPPRFIPSARNTFVAPPPAKRSSAGRRFAVLVGALILIGAAAAAVIVTSTTSSPSPASPFSSNAPAAFDPAHVTVAVLNGTGINQLAHHVAARLGAEGYKQGVIATASNQTVSSTTVAYLAGPRNRTDALHVANALHLGSGAVAPIDQAARAVACPPPAACTANVVVTVGQDLAGT